MTDKELLQQALDALEKHIYEYETIQAIKARLAQPEPEPVAWQVKFRDDDGIPQIAWFPHPVHPESNLAKRPYIEEPLYTAPPKKEWVGLTDEEIKDSWSQLWYDLNNGKFAATDDPSRHTNVMFARAIEAKLKEKNSG